MNRTDPIRRAARVLTLASTLGALLALAAGPAGGQGARNLLAGRWAPEAVAAALVPAGKWKPYPTIADRGAWSAVPQATRDAFVRQAEQLRGTTWERIPLTTTLQYVRDGNRSNYDAINTAQRVKLATLLTAELFEDQGRFLDDIANGIWAISEQTYWGSTAHLTLQSRGSGLPDVTEPTVDLFAAETGALFAWADYLLGDRLDRVSPLLRERMRVEVERRILEPALRRDDFWWMGYGERKNLNNWTPWIASNWLTAVLQMESDPGERAAAVSKILRVLDNFLNIYPDDGSSDEGPGYWGHAGASTFDNLELLRTATGGAIDLYDHPLIRNMGQYIYRVYIKDQYFVPMGDASAKTTPDAELVYRYGTRIDDPVMRGFGAWLAQRRGPYQPGSYSPLRILPAVLAQAEIAAHPAAEPLLASAWLPDLQLMAARQAAGSSSGLYLSAWGGHNAQSHNHNDVGNFIVYGDGRPVLIDVGVETYSAKTFSPQRYEIWTMQSGYHNLPTINGVMQGAGRDFEAREVTFRDGRNEVIFEADLAPAYPAEAAVDRWARTARLDRRAGRVEIRDRYQLREWKEPLRMNLMTQLQVDLSRPGVIHLREEAAQGGAHWLVTYDAAKFRAATEEIPIRDARLLPVWGPRLARIVLTSTGRALRDEVRVVVRKGD